MYLQVKYFNRYEVKQLPAILTRKGQASDLVTKLKPKPGGMHRDYKEFWIKLKQPNLMSTEIILY